ncbi:MAG: phosphonate C-P lyase system protein PhnH [Magnetovibrionaceae bacterium]
MPDDLRAIDQADLSSCPARTDLPGFDNPVMAAQEVFMATLRAFAEPGTVQNLRNLPKAPSPLSPAANGILLSLADPETPLWLDPSAEPLAAAGHLRFHTGAPLVMDRSKATFAWTSGDLLAGDAETALGGFNLGRDDYPDQAATLIVEVDELAQDGPVRLAGPGIKGHRAVSLAAPFITPAFWEARALISGLFPRGLDLLFVQGSRLVGLPRTTVVEV